MMQTMNFTHGDLHERPQSRPRTQPGHQASPSTVTVTSSSTVASAAPASSADSGYPTKVDATHAINRQLPFDAWAMPVPSDSFHLGACLEPTPIASDGMKVVNSLPLASGSSLGPDLSCFRDVAQDILLLQDVLVCRNPDDGHDHCHPPHECAIPFQPTSSQLLSRSPFDPLSMANCAASHGTHMPSTERPAKAPMALPHPSHTQSHTSIPPNAHTYAHAHAHTYPYPFDHSFDQSYPYARTQMNMHEENLSQEVRTIAAQACHHPTHNEALAHATGLLQKHQPQRHQDQHWRSMVNAVADVNPAVHAGDSRSCLEPATLRKELDDCNDILGGEELLGEHQHHDHQRQQQRSTASAGTATTQHAHPAMLSQAAGNIENHRSPLPPNGTDVPLHVASACDEKMPIRKDGSDVDLASAADAGATNSHDPNEGLQSTGPARAAKRRKICDSDSSVGSDSNAAPTTSMYAENWNRRYKQLVAYKQRFGHCHVPHITGGANGNNSASTDDSGGDNGNANTTNCGTGTGKNSSHQSSLAHWARRQRHQYKLKMQGKSSSLSNERQEALEALGFVWDPNNAAWEEKYQQLVDFAKEHGHSQVPRWFEQNPPLAIWVKCQRRHFARMKKQAGLRTSLTPDRIRRLEMLGFVWYAKANPCRRK